MATLTLDFLHNYRSGERRAADPENAYQYDEGHVLEAILPAAVETCEIHYWLPGIVEAETFATNTITANADGTTTITGHIPNRYFESSGELRIYIVVTDDDASITTYEGKVLILPRAMPADYLDSDPNNQALSLLAAAEQAITGATTATTAATAASESATAAASSASAAADSATAAAASEAACAEVSDAITAANTAASAANTAATSANTAATSANSAATAANTAASTANTAADAANAAIDRLSYVGMVIFSTTLSTMADVVNQYGGTTWIQHSGYFLYGADSNVTANSATSDGGEATHTLTVDELPSHSHMLSSQGGYYVYGGASTTVGPASGNGYRTEIGTRPSATTGGGAAHNNMPPYKNVFIWERTA